RGGCGLGFGRRLAGRRALQDLSLRETTRHPVAAGGPHEHPRGDRPRAGRRPTAPPIAAGPPNTPGRARPRRPHRAAPESAVSADTMNARPVRDAATSTDSSGVRPRRRSSTNRSRVRDVNSVHAATTKGPPTAVTGLSLRLNAYATRDAVPTAISTGTRESS